jgi:hypothetical protein
MSASSDLKKGIGVIAYKLLIHAPRWRTMLVPKRGHAVDDIAEY